MLSTTRLALIKARTSAPAVLRRVRRGHTMPFARRFCTPRLVLPSACFAQQQQRARKPPTSAVHLPRKLARHAPRASVTAQAIRAADPSLADVPPAYIREKLASFGTQMLKAIANTHAEVPRGSLTMTVPVSFSGDVAEISRPTHMLAVHAPGSAHIALYPAHSIVLASHCAHLPPLASSPSTSTALPVLSLALPAPQTFPLLQHYLYTHDARTVLAALLPASPVPTRAEVLRSAAVVNGLWRNVIALGVEDTGVWQVMDAAWAGVLHGLTRGGA